MKRALTLLAILCVFERDEDGWQIEHCYEIAPNPPSIVSQVADVSSD